MLVQRSQEEFELLLLLVGNRGFAMANVVAMGGGGGGGGGDLSRGQTGCGWGCLEAAKVDGLRELGEA